MIGTIMRRTNIKALREFLLYGAENNIEDTKDYKDKLKNSYEKQRAIVEEYDESGVNSKLNKVIDEILYDYENIYMELGLKAGFVLAKDAFAMEKIETNPDSLYKELYLTLFREITDSVDNLKNIQRKTEEIYLNQNDGNQ